MFFIIFICKLMYLTSTKQMNEQQSILYNNSVFASLMQTQQQMRT